MVLRLPGRSCGKTGGCRYRQHSLVLLADTLGELQAHLPPRRRGLIVSRPTRRRLWKSGFTCFEQSILRVLHCGIQNDWEPAAFSNIAA
jgi:hypothetical protein